jgi:hypothetical protein
MDLYQIDRTRSRRRGSLIGRVDQFGHRDFPVAGNAAVQIR